VARPTPRRLALRGGHLVGLLLTVGLVAAPAVALVHATLPYQPPVMAAPVVRVPPSAARLLPFPPFRAAIPVLLYHDVSGRNGRYSVTPLQLAEHLAVLRAAGFESAGLDQVRALLAGVPVRLPARPVMLAFSGGLATHWTAVTPILQAYGFRGVAFVPSGAIAERSPSYYLTEDQLRAMRRSDVWEFASQTHAGTGTVATGRGRVGAWLTARGVQPDGQVESTESWRSRVVADLDRGREVLGRLVGHQVDVLGYPAITARLPATDPALGRELDAVLGERFAMAFASGGPPAMVFAGSPRYHVPTIAVRGGESGAALVRKLRRATPAGLPSDPSLLPFRTARGSLRRTGPLALRLTGAAFTRTSLDLNTVAWTDYRLTARVAGVSRHATALLAARVNAAGAVEVLVGEHRVVVRQRIGGGRATLGEIRWPAGAAHHVAARTVDLRLLRDVLVLRVDGRTVGPAFLDARLGSGGIGLGLIPRGRQSVTFSGLRVQAVSRGVPAGARRDGAG
jgi:Polysaccharide deacetylase